MSSRVRRVKEISKRVSLTTERLKVLDLNGLWMNDWSGEQGSCRHGLPGSRIKQSIETSTVTEFGKKRQYLQVNLQLKTFYKEPILESILTRDPWYHYIKQDIFARKQRDSYKAWTMYCSAISARNSGPWRRRLNFHYCSSIYYSHLKQTRLF